MSTETKATWDSIFKALVTVALGAILTWSTWATKSIITFGNWKDQGPRFLQADAEKLELKVKADARELVDNRTTAIEKKIDDMRGILADLKTMLARHEAATKEKDK